MKLLILASVLLCCSCKSTNTKVIIRGELDVPLNTQIALRDDDKKLIFSTNLQSKHLLMKLNKIPAGFYQIMARWPKDHGVTHKLSYRSAFKTIYIDPRQDSLYLVSITSLGKKDALEDSGGLLYEEELTIMIDSDSPDSQLMNELDSLASWYHRRNRKMYDSLQYALEQALVNHKSNLYLETAYKQMELWSDSLRPLMQNRIMTLVGDHPNSAIAPYALHTYFSLEDQSGEIKQAYKRLGSTAKESKYGQILSKKVNDLNSTVAGVE